MTKKYDGIILGTGHNALVLQAYLSRCGLQVLSLDRSEKPGGGLVTIENPNDRYSPMFPVEIFQETLLRIVTILTRHEIRFHLTGGLTELHMANLA